jgi:hypothetical protein
MPISRSQEPKQIAPGLRGGRRSRAMRKPPRTRPRQHRKKKV